MKPKPDYDQAFKVIADSDPDGFLWPILQRQVQWLRSRSPELPARRRQADLVWEVTRPNGQRGIIHIELQVKAEQTGQEDIRERMADYALRIWKRDHLPARSVVIFLKPVATVPASPFG